MVASTIVNITNNTGKTVTFADKHDYHGHIKHGTDYPPKPAYPQKIEDGQTVKFVFENNDVRVNGESSGTVVYRGTNEKGTKFEWMYAWYNMDGADESTYKAYTVIAPDGHYNTSTVDWKYVRELLMKSDNFTSEVWNKCATEAKISTQEEGVVYDAKMYLKGG